MNQGDSFPPKAHIARNAHINSMEEYQRLYRLSLDDPETFWAKQADRLTWFHPWETVFDSDYDHVDFGWFLSGRLNACYNCVDRHLKSRGDQAAIIWARDEPGQYQTITYRDLKHEVSRVANVLRYHGVRRNDRVCLYMPMIPELAYTMLACARIGAVHSIVFGGFSAESIRDRILDAGAKVVVTANEGLRGGRRLPLKQTVDRAVDGLDLVETVLVARRTETDVPMRPGRDHWLDEECKRQRSTCTFEWMGAEDPLFILYTSGSTGKPKGVLHTTGGYMVFAATTHHYIFDHHPGEVYFCAADIGWITGRVDDVINVSGHRLGTAEVESALVSHEAVAEAAVVGFPHDIKGQGIFAYVILHSDAEANGDALEIAGALKEQVRHVIGPFARPDEVMIVPGLPKTRSGKIMRRILRRIAAGTYDDMGNITTLADPAIVDELIEIHQGL